MKNNGKARILWVLWVFLAAPVILILGVLALLSIPCTAGAIVYIKVSDEIFFRRLKARQRVMNWSEVERHLEDGTGTLIIEQANKIGARFWWAADDLTTIAPVPIINRYEDLDLSYVTGITSDPFVPWCFENYLSIEKGKAILTRLKNLKLPPGPVKSEFFLNLYPRAKIVQTLLTRPSTSITLVNQMKYAKRGKPNTKPL